MKNILYTVFIVTGRSSLLVFFLGLGAMFVLLSVASQYAGISPKERQIQEVQAARINANIARTVEPENICFTVNNEILDKYPALTQAIADADEFAENDIRRNDLYGNYYTGTVADLDRSQMLSLLRTYNFNQTISHNPAINRYFVYQDTNFHCGFNYSDKHYLLSFFFRALDEINTEHGYVPIHVSKGLVDKTESTVANAVTYVPFNNTVVFFNELSHPVTIEIRSTDSGISETITLPPSKMQDINLGPNWSSPADTVYHYKIIDYPWIEGNISASREHYVGCMSEEVAKSLYAQTDFEVKFPSYLPDGFRTGCIAENLSSYVIQVYVNRTATDYYTSKGIMYSRDNPFPFYLYGSMPEDEVKGIVQVHAQKYYLAADNPREQGYNAYQNMLNNTSGYWTNPQFIEDDENGISYRTFNEGKYLSMVDVLTADESYRVVGALPMDEVMKIAKSLSARVR